MTLGQRIQEARKQAGLSQEALGEHLGVSRQSISKWEGGVTIPEIDKLIAMSRLFGQPVGVLLGVEPPADPEEPPPSQREQAVEAILERYVAEATAHRRPGTEELPSIPMDLTLSLEPGDSLTLAAMVTDSLGRTWPVVLDAMTVAENDWINPTDYPDLSTLSFP